jgi:hypothetical protein
MEPVEIAFGLVELGSDALLAWLDQEHRKEPIALLSRAESSVEVRMRSMAEGFEYRQRPLISGRL